MSPPEISSAESKWLDLDGSGRTLWEFLFRAASVQAPDTEVFSATGCNEKEIDQACKGKWGITWVEYRARVSSTANVDLRASQYDAAKQGKAQAQIWLGKNLLGQQDRGIAKSDSENMNRQVEQAKLAIAADPSLIDKIFPPDSNIQRPPRGRPRKAQKNAACKED